MPAPDPDLPAGRGDEPWLDAGLVGHGPGIGTIWVTAPSMAQLAEEIARALADFAPQDVVSVSHSVVQAGWEPRRAGALGGGYTHLHFEYSALILVRTA